MSAFNAVKRLSSVLNFPYSIVKINNFTHA